MTKQKNAHKIAPFEKTNENTKPMKQQHKKPKEKRETNDDENCQQPTRNNM